MRKLRVPSILFFLIMQTSCSNQDNDDGVVTTEEIPEDALIQETLFSSSLTSIEIISAALEDGTTEDCFQLTFSGDGVDGDEGPYCPETIDEVGGIAVYDGETNPGLRSIARELLEDMETDGWDIVDEEGNVHIDLFDGSANLDASYCLAAPYDPDFTFTYVVPVYPKMATTTSQIDEVENLGFSVEGTPLTGDPPSAVNGPAMLGGNNSGEINFPSLDPCGGHPDPAGYYHAHFIPQVMNQVLAANEISEVTCTLFNQTAGTVLAGFAKDGYPIYAYANMPTDLDECNGRTAATSEYPDGVYHYVASTTEAPNMPPCLKGVVARNSFQAVN